MMGETRPLVHGRDSSLSQKSLHGFLTDDPPSMWSWRDHLPRPQAVTETSRKTYRKLISEGKRESQAQLIIKALLRRVDGLTYNELSRVLGIKINAVCGRMNELRRIESFDGELLIICGGVTTDEYTGVKNMIWQVNPLLTRDLP